MLLPTDAYASLLSRSLTWEQEQHETMADELMAVA